jgi:hypothetical protein
MQSNILPQPTITTMPPQPTITTMPPQPTITTMPPQPTITTMPPQPTITTIPPQSEMITTPPPITTYLTKDDRERVIIIKINNNNEKKLDLKIDTDFLGLIFDDLISLIKKLVKKLISDSNKKLDIKEINNLLPKFIATSSENILKLITMVIFNNDPNTNDIDNIKTKLLSLLQNNIIPEHLLKYNNINSSINNLQNSTNLLNDEIMKSKNNLINDARLDIPDIFSKIIYDMSKNILNNIILFDKDGNMIESNNINMIKNEFKNILNKYLPYKQVYFETSTNGSNNPQSITLKLNQLNQEEKIEPVKINQEDISIHNYLNDDLVLKNVYEEINKSKNLSRINMDNIPPMSMNRSSNNMFSSQMETNNNIPPMSMNGNSNNIMNLQKIMNNIPPSTINISSNNMLSSQMETSNNRGVNKSSSNMSNLYTQVSSGLASIPVSMEMAFDPIDDTNKTSKNLMVQNEMKNNSTNIKKNINKFNNLVKKVC